MADDELGALARLADIFDQLRVAMDSFAALTGRPSGRKRQQTEYSAGPVGSESSTCSREHSGS